MRKNSGGGAERTAQGWLRFDTVVCVSHLPVPEDGWSALEDGLHGGWEVVACLQPSPAGQRELRGLSVLVPHLQFLLETECKE